MTAPTRCPTCDTDVAALKPVANGLFGPGIFATGIDLSALDSDTAWRLGVFFGQQVKAAEERGYAQATAEMGRVLGKFAEVDEGLRDRLRDDDEEPRV